MPKRREKFVDGGDAKLVAQNAPSPEESLEVVRAILSECPDGYHLWRFEVQKSDRGRRAAVRVWFKRNRPREEEGPV